MSEPLVSRSPNVVKRLLRPLQRFGKIPPRDLVRIRKLLLLRKVSPYSMAGYARLSNVYDLAVRAVRSKIPGAFVECGVWKGGCSAILASIAQTEVSMRKTWLFDSFEGLPEPSFLDGEKARQYASDRMDGELRTIEKCVGPLEEVQHLLFNRLELDTQRIEMVNGWFQQTLPVVREKIGAIAILRLDGDWYESTKTCLENLYDQVVPGGYVILDDYGHWEGCRKAVDEFMASRNLDPVYYSVDYTCRYFVKS